MVPKRLDGKATGTASLYSTRRGAITLYPAVDKIGERISPLMGAESCAMTHSAAGQKLVKANINVQRYGHRKSGGNTHTHTHV